VRGVDFNKYLGRSLVQWILLLGVTWAIVIVVAELGDIVFGSEGEWVDGPVVAALILGGCFISAAAIIRGVRVMLARRRRSRLS